MAELARLNTGIFGSAWVVVLGYGGVCGGHVAGWKCPKGVSRMDGWKNTWERLEEAGVPIVPVERLAESEMLQRLANAGVVYGVDLHTKLGAVFFGDRETGAMDRARTVAFALDFDTNDLDRLS